VIVTVTLNPSLDLTYALSEPSLGTVEVHRAASATVEASGKGVNVSRTLRRAGFATAAVLPVGGATGQHLDELLTLEQVEHVAVPVQGDTRINTSLLLGSGRTVKVNGPGTSLRPADVDRLLAEVSSVLGRIDRAGGRTDREVWVAVCGSLPPGVTPDVMRQLVDLAHGHDARCVADVSGPALAAALEAGADLLAPNALELGELLDADLHSATVPEVARVAVEVARGEAPALLVSLGAAGALFTDGSRIVHGSGPVLVPVNTAGAGDAFLAGWLATTGDAEQRMSRAVAFGRSACLSPNTVDPHPGTKGVGGITVTDITTQHLQEGRP
jgi:1-phosphofructokinase